MITKIERISVYPVTEKKKKIQQNAKFYGLNVSEFLIVVGSQDALPITQEERNLLFQIIFEIKKAGINLNQIAKALNYSGLFNTEPPSKIDVDSAIQEFRAVVQTLAEKV
jgi:hypothetical protein